MNVDRTASAPAPEATDTTSASSKAADRARLAKLAQEFESLLLSNVLRDMRSAGRWSEEESSDTLGAGAFGQTFDTELARSLSQSGGFGLSSFLLKAFDRYASVAGSSPLPAAASPSLAAAPTIASQPESTTSAVSASIGRAASVETAASSSVDAPGIAASTDGLARPTAKLTSGFGWRRDPITGAAKFHRGVDLKAAEGDPVGATGAGRVVFSGRNGGYGTNVIVEHANGLRTRYAHLSAALVNAGDTVAEGQAVGLAGHTGRATGPHVHYEVLADGRAVDPLR